MINKYGKSKDQGRVEEALEEANATWIEEGWVCKGDLDLSELGIISLPMIKTVEGGFSCGYNELKTLEGSPETVGGDFHCYNNQLKTLEGSPETIGGSFSCGHNRLKSLIGSPKIIGGDFYCYNNELKTLEGSPETIGGTFYCYNNELGTLEGAPKIIGGVFCCDGNQLKSLSGSPEVVGGNFYCYNNQLKTLEGSPEVVGGKFHCYNNELKTLEGSPETVGGDFYCYNNQLKTLEGSPETIGGSLSCGYNQLETLDGAPEENVDQGSLVRWPGGKYASIDGIFGEIIKKHNDVWKMRKILGKEYYVVNDGNGNYAHGDSIKEAKEDLLFKICKRNKDDYKELTLDSILKHDEAVICYRVITGACRPGVKDFIENSLGEPKEEYSIREIIELTDGKYGNKDFREFF